MKTAHYLIAISLVALTACSTTHTADRKNRPPSKDEPETVLVIYHAREGKESDLQELLGKAWDLYRKERMVFTQPHVVIRDKEAGTGTRFVEVFTWINHSLPQHAPDTVQKMWEQEQLLCESRDGRQGIEGGEVKLVSPTTK